LDEWACSRVIGQFHHIIEIALRKTRDDMEDVDKPGVGAGNRLEFAQAFEFPMKGIVVRKLTPRDLLDGVKTPNRVPAQPHFAVSPFANLLDNFVVRELRTIKAIRIGGVHALRLCSSRSRAANRWSLSGERS